MLLQKAKNAEGFTGGDCRSVMAAHVVSAGSLLSCLAAGKDMPPKITSSLSSRNQDGPVRLVAVPAGDFLGSAVTEDRSKSGPGG